MGRVRHTLGIIGMLFVAALLVSSPAGAIKVTVDTEIPGYVLTDDLNLTGSLETTYESVRYAGAKWWDTGTYDNLTVSDNGELWLIPDFNITMLNGGNAILTGGAGWDARLMSKHVIRHKGTYYLYYAGSAHTNGSDPQIGLATSRDGVTYTKYPGNPVITRGPASFDCEGAKRPIVLYDQGTWRMWYAGAAVNESYDICYATSRDGYNWTKASANPVLGRHNFNTSWYYGQVQPVGVLKNNATSYHLYVEGNNDDEWQLGRVHSANGTVWPQNIEHLRTAQDNNWEESVANFQTVEEGHGTYRIWSYCGNGTRRLGYSWSRHGNSWPDSVGPILSPADGTIYSQNLEGPTAVDEGDHYYMVMKCSDATTKRYGAWRMYPQRMNATFTSRLHTLKNVSRLAEVDWDEGRPAGGDLDIYLRWGNSTDNLTEWYGFDYEHRPVNITARHFQFRAVFRAPEDWYRIGLRYFELKVQAVVADVSVRVDDGPWRYAGWNHINWWMNLDLEDGDHIVYVRATDLYDEVAWANRSVKVDLYPPEGSMVLGEGRNATGNRTIAYHLEANDTHGVPYCQLSFLPDLRGAIWEPFHENGTLDYPGIDGNVTVYARFRDGAGRVSTIVSDSIIFDTTEPYGRVSIDNGSRYTIDHQVHLTITWSDLSGVVDVRISESPWDRDAPTWSQPPYPNVLELPFTLSPNDGRKVVYVILRDEAGWETMVLDDIILDTTPPAASFTINGGDHFTRSPEVRLDVEVHDVNPVSVRWANEEEDWKTDWATLDTPSTLPWTLNSEWDGVKTVRLLVRDAAGNEVVETANIVLDTVPPQVELVINGGDAVTPTPFVLCDLNASDITSGLWRMRVGSMAALSREPWQRVLKRFEWILSPGDGFKTVYVEVQDNAGHITRASATVLLDMEAPEGMMLIDEGDEFTASPKVGVVLKVTGIDPGKAQMRLSESGTLEGAEWQPFSLELDWTFSDGDGERTLYAEVMDQAGNVAYLMDSIVLDTVAPTGTLYLNDGDAFTRSQTIELRLSIREETSGVQSMKVMETEDIDEVDWRPFSNRLFSGISAGDGTKTLRVVVMDRAGWLVELSADITLDTTPPVAWIIINGNATYTNVTSVNVSVWASDEGSGVAGIQVLMEDGSGVGDMEPFEDWFLLDLSGPDGLRFVYVRVLDIAGNAVSVNDTIILDTAPPVVGFADTGRSRVEDNRVTLAPTCHDDIDPHPTIEYRVDGGPWHPYERVRLIVEISVGTHTVEVRATDAAGNSAIAETEVERVEKWFSSSGSWLLLLLITVFVFLAAITMNERRRTRD